MLGDPPAGHVTAALGGDFFHLAAAATFTVARGEQNGERNRE